MNVNYINPFIAASKSVLGSILGTDIVIGRPRIEPIIFKEDVEVVLIGITGEVKGQVFLGFNSKVACKLASTMIGFEVTELDELSISAVAELSNMILGTAATMFAHNRILVDITPPTSVKGNVQFHTQDVEHVMIPVNIGDNLSVDIHIALTK